MAFLALKKRIPALVVLAGTTALPGILLAQTVNYPVCPPDAVPVAEMCALGWPEMEDASAYHWSYPSAISADGSTVVGEAYFDNNYTYRAFRWVDDGTGMLDLGTLRADNTGWAYARAVSADGSVIVGRANTDDNTNRAFRWMDDGAGMLDLGTLRSNNTGWSYANAISADGSVIVGEANTDDNTYRAFRWMDDGAGMLDLGTLRVNNTGWSNAYAVSADGSVIVGHSNTDDNTTRAFRWMDDGSGMLDLGTLRDDNLRYSWAAAISADGSVIVGEANTDDNTYRAFRWMDDGMGMLDLGTLRVNNAGWSYAYAVSADGSVIVGHSNTDDNTTRAFRWMDDGSGMLDLGTLRDDNLRYSWAAAVSADGSVIVGSAETDDDTSRAFRWMDDDTGMLDLGSLRPDNLGWSYASAVSADGTVIVGYAEAEYSGNGIDRGSEGSDGIETAGISTTSRAFIWRSGVMLDHLNTAAAVVGAAQDLAAASAHYGQLAEWQIGEELEIEGPGRSAQGATVSTQGELAPHRRMALRLGGSLRHSSSVATSGGADMAVAVDMGGGYTLGAFVDLSRETNSRSAVSLKGTYLAGGAWLRFRENHDRSGLTWRLAASTGTGNFDVTRLDVLPNTERGEGRTRMNTAAMSAEVGYGFALANGVAVPFARLTGTRTTRSAYDETNAVGFPLSFDSHRETALVLTLGTDLRFDLSERASLELGAGVSHDLRRSLGDITGTSAIPGFTNFAIAGPAVVNRTRGYVTMGYVHGLNDGAAMRLDLSAAQSPWSGSVRLGARLGYEMRF